MQVLPGDAVLKLNLNESVQFIEVGFKNLKWAINLKWLNGEAYLEKGWIEFLQECRIAVGDVVVFSKKLSSNFFRVVFFSETLGATSSSYSGIYLRSYTMFAYLSKVLFTSIILCYVTVLLI